MAAYVIADIEVIDAAGYEEYRQKVPRRLPLLVAVTLHVEVQPKSSKALGRPSGA